MPGVTGPHPAVAAVRTAVRVSVADLVDPARASGSGRTGPGTAAGAHAPLVLVACSGGADSLALAGALAFVAPRSGLRAGALTVDHGLQEQSARRARELAERLRATPRLDPVEVLTVVVGTGGGPEAAARSARYAALCSAAERTGAAAVLLGHTLDDQAETVLLGLARGSGTRSLSGMAARRGIFRRPLLGLRREVTRAACAATGTPVWDDPDNTDPRFARVRVRTRLLPVLEEELGPGVAAALARTATAARADADALDVLATELWTLAGGGVRPSADRPAADCTGVAGTGLNCTGVASSGLDCTVLAGAPAALRRRVLRAAALGAGSAASGLTAGHVDALESLVLAWHGQRGVDLPGAVTARRTAGRLVFTARTTPVPR